MQAAAEAIAATQTRGGPRFPVPDTVFDDLRLVAAYATLYVATCVPFKAADISLCVDIVLEAFGDASLPATIHIPFHLNPRR